MRLLTITTLLLLPVWTLASDEISKKRKASPLEMSIVLKSDKIVWDADEKKRKEFKAALEKAEKDSKKEPAEEIKLPAQPDFAATVIIKNVSDKDVKIVVEGDENVLTLELKGPAVFNFTPLRSFTADFRGGRAVTLKPGERYEMPIQQLSDGFRGKTRDIYWADLGEYTLTATYLIGEGENKIGLKSEPVQFKVEEKK